ncbi:MAG: CinA family nicotinamide mononucleotide deamidase-related protein [candidate division KSB1 bacterium]|nr:CinA family nicotinamide mononucleotide deamidase-related protein [candidate division KSB1 bacterium]MDZ7319297.1 CinA family nicotinamide mononucleotide deamidase-related protein [candidate division KSB1 bacterium]MDZ7342601.1 CinA family nicotinamide mononucleotide deamidase-related protein [candidate division KSB1 bacterium]
MRAEIIAIGDELLLGQVVNTNATFIAQKLTGLGLDVQWITAVGDNHECLLDALRIAEQRVDVIIATGGLGPTHDDITKQVFAEYFQSELILDAGLLEKLQDRFQRRGRTLTPSNRSQAIVPHNATILENEVGTAPGLLFRKGKKFFFVLPGVPAEMMWLMQEKVQPMLQNKAQKVIHYRVLHTTGIAESSIYEGLDQIDALERQAKIAFLPTYSGVNIRLTAEAATFECCEAKIQSVEAVFREKFGDYIWGVDDETLADVVAAMLIKQKKTCAVIELGTNGAVAAELTQAIGSRHFFLFGINAPTGEACQKLPGLGHISCSAIEAENCRQLAEELQRISHADINLAVRHNEQMEITSWIALNHQGQTVVREYIIKFQPATNIQRLTALALMFLYQHLRGQKSS